MSFGHVRTEAYIPSVLVRSFLLVLCSLAVRACTLLVRLSWFRASVSAWVRSFLPGSLFARCLCYPLGCPPTVLQKRLETY